MRFENFVGGTYQSWSPNVDAERSINLYPEIVESAGGKSRVALYGTPGLTVFCTLPTSPVRGLWAGENRLFAVAGSHYYEIMSGGSYTDRGDVGDDGSHTPVDIWPNGSQVMIVSAGKVWIDTGTALVQPVYGLGYGAVDAKATSSPVHWVSGDKFSAAQVGGNITIDGTVYTVDRYVNPTTITVTPTTGDLLNVNYADPAGRSGVVIANTRYNVLYRVDGDSFLPSFENGPIILYAPGTDPATAGTSYTVWRVVDEDQLIVEEPLGADFIGYGYIIPTGDDGELIQVEATRGAFIDGYFAIQLPNSKNFAFSHQWDGKEWDPLDQSVKESYPDNIAAIYADHEELWLFGTHWSTEVWRNEGVAEAPAGFVRDPGAFMHIACVAPWSIASLASGLHFLGGDTRGRIIAYRAQGFQPVRISTHGVEAIWNTYTTVWDAYAYAYREQGHEFWVLNFQTANATWVYDVASQMWHERAKWNGTSFDRHKGRCHAYVFDKHLVGAWDSGKVYQMSHNILTDEGAAIRRVRVAPHIANEQQRVFHHSMQIDLEITSGAPTVTLDWSDDDTDTWSTPRTRAPSRPDKRRGRVIFNRLGSSRDRVYRVTISDTAKVAIVDALLNPALTPGIS